MATKQALTFEDLDFRPHRAGSGGVQARHDYPNGYGVSVVRFRGSYGYESGLYELAVTKGGSLCYDTPITDDVLGHLTPEEVTATLALVAALPTPAVRS